MGTVKDLRSKMRTFNNKNSGKDRYLIVTPVPSLPSLHLEGQPLHVRDNLVLNYFPLRLVLIEQGLVVFVALFEVEALLCLHEPLLRQSDDSPRRRRRNNIEDYLLHEEIVECETTVRIGAVEVIAREMDDVTVLHSGRRALGSGARVR